MPFFMRDSMARILINAVILMSILQLGGAVVPAAATELNRGGGTIRDTVQAARNQGVPDKVLTDLLARAVDRGIDPDRVRSLLGMLAEIRREGVPLKPFLEKVDEALAKGVNFTQIEANLQARLGDFRFVVRILEEKYPQGHVLEGPELPAVVRPQIEDVPDY